MNAQLLQAFNDIVLQFIDENVHPADDVKLEWLENYSDKVKSLLEKSVSENSDKPAKKKNTKKPKDAPKNPRTAYNFFCEQNRKRLKEEHPDASAKEITKEINIAWKLMKEEYPEEVAKFQESADEDKERYIEEMKIYDPTFDPTIKKKRVKVSSEDEEEDEKPKKEKKKKDKDAPKKARSAYIFFCSDKRESIKKKNPELKPTEITIELGAAWKKIRDTKKADKYKTMAEEDKRRYDYEMKNLNKKQVGLDDDDDETETVVDDE